MPFERKMRIEGLDRRIVYLDVDRADISSIVKSEQS